MTLYKRKKMELIFPVGIKELNLSIFCFLALVLLFRFPSLVLHPPTRCPAIRPARGRKVTGCHQILSLNDVQVEVASTRLFTPPALHRGASPVFFFFSVFSFLQLISRNCFVYLSIIHFSTWWHCNRMDYEEELQ